MALRDSGAVRVDVAERFGDDPWDRDRAVSLQATKLIPAVRKGHGVIFDFADVDFLSQSFAGALVCKLREELGEEFPERVQFTNTDPVLDSILRLSTDFPQADS